MRTAVLTLALAAAGLHAQTAPGLEELVRRLATYLEQYERQLSTVIAQERFQQTETPPPPGRSVLQGGVRPVRKRTIESEVAFLRLPGEREWYGVRHVVRVDGRPVDSAGRNLLDALQAGAAKQETLIREIVRVSSAHNLGSSRTINMPTVPLELLHPRNGKRLAFEAGNTAKISGVLTRELKFAETSTPSMVRDTEGRDLLARGSAWIEPATGRVWRVVIRFALERAGDRHTSPGMNEMRLEFARHPELDLLVPRELREDFQATTGARVQGRATYSQFRRFTTSARIIPR